MYYRDGFKFIVEYFFVLIKVEEVDVLLFLDVGAEYGESYLG